MRIPVSAVAATLALLWSSHTAGAQTAAEKGIHQWWRDRPVGRPLASPNAKKLPLISVRGNKFVDTQGNPVLFRGLSISDPDKIEGQGHWNKEHFAKVKEMGAMLVRIPVHPVAWRERTPQEYLKLLDQAVEWCTDLGMYIDVDWHSIGNLKTGLFQDPMYDTSMSETFNFWRTIARHFAGHNTPAFYEFFNEPATFNNQLGRVSWDEWKRINEDLISVIRAHDREKIPLVAAFDWAYDLTPLRISPLEAEGVGYVTHPYANKRPRPWEPKWEEDFGFAAGRYPILATEFGFSMPRGGNAPNADYGPAIVKYLEGKGIGWLAWVFDPEWGPQMLTSWETYGLTASGEFFKQAMHGKIEAPPGAERPKP
jgi:endoglucanase